MRAFALRPLPMTLSSTNTAAGHDAAYAGNDHMGVVWKAAAAAAPKLKADLGTVPNPVDAALLFAVGGAATQLRVRAADNSGMTTNLYDSGIIPLLAGSEMPVSGLGVGWWTKDDGAITRRYWELEFSAAAGTVAPSVGRVAMGERITLARNFAFGGAWGVRDLGKADFSAGGALLRRRAAKLRVLGITFPHVDKDEIERHVLPLVEGHGAQDPIALCTDPAADAMRQRRCWFGPLTGDLGSTWRSAAGWEWRANLIDLTPIPAGPVYVPPVNA